MPEPYDVLEEVIAPRLEAPVAGALAPTPYNFEFTGEDALRLTVHNSQSGVVVAVHYRMKDRRQQLLANRFTLTPTSDRVATSIEFPIGEGHLLNVTVFASNGAPRRGQTFARLQVIRGRGAAATVLGTIVQGYATGSQDRAWPGSPIEGSLDGDGYLRSIAGTDPAAGNEWTETVPAGARWEPVTVSYSLLNSSAPANRKLYWVIKDGAAETARAKLFTLGADGGQTVFLLPGFTPADAVPDAGVVALSFPMGLQLLAGMTIGSTTPNLQAGDNYGAPLLTVREWLEANQ